MITRTSITFDFRDNIDAAFALFASASIHCWAVFVDKGYISEAPIEEPGISLSEEFTYTYLGDGRSIWERVGRGWWVSYNPENELVPETMFSDRRPTYLLPPSPNIQDDEEGGDQSPTPTTYSELGLD